jgi:hypothetical protein
MKEACTLVANRDVEAMVPLIIRSINTPTEVQETVHKLASTTFVQAVSRGGARGARASSGGTCQYRPRA